MNLLAENLKDGALGERRPTQAAGIARSLGARARRSERRQPSEISALSGAGVRRETKIADNCELDAKILMISISYVTAE
jgi:hypothetical protein